MQYQCIKECFWRRRLWQVVHITKEMSYPDIPPEEFFSPCLESKEPTPDFSQNPQGEKLSEDEVIATRKVGRPRKVKTSPPSKK